MRAGAAGSGEADEAAEDREFAELLRLNVFDMLEGAKALEHAAKWCLHTSETSEASWSEARCSCRPSHHTSPLIALPPCTLPPCIGRDVSSLTRKDLHSELGQRVVGFSAKDHADIIDALLEYEADSTKARAALAAASAAWTAKQRQQQQQQQQARVKARR